LDSIGSIPALTICPVQNTKWLGIAKMLAKLAKPMQLQKYMEPDGLRYLNRVLQSKMRKSQDHKNVNYRNMVRSMALTNPIKLALIGTYLDTLYNGTHGGKLLFTSF
jgi:hypothetical protein